MSDLESPRYTPVSTKHYIGLLIDLLDQLPELLREIAPNGFDNCIYHQVFYPEPEQAYELYNLIQMKEYLCSGCKSSLDDGQLFLSKAEFLENYVAPQPNLELEAFTVYISAISDIFNTLSVVHDRQKNCFKLHLTFADSIFMASRLTTAIGSFYNIKELFPPYRYAEVDLQPIYRFIFRYLLSLGLEYQYLSYGDKFKAEWQEMSNPYSDLSIQAWLELSNDQISTEMVDEIDKISEHMDVSDMMQFMDTPPVVAAYLDVYGDWPEGYL